MPRLNLTLDDGTFNDLKRRAVRLSKPPAQLATELLRESLARRRMHTHRIRLARDYAAGRKDAQEILADIELAQFELLGDDEA